MMEQLPRTKLYVQHILNSPAVRSLPKTGLSSSSGPSNPEDVKVTMLECLALLTSALRHLSTAEYEAAHECFSTIIGNSRLIDVLPSMNSIVSVKDIAIYSSICALLCCNRLQMKAQLLNTNFRSLCDAVPSCCELLVAFANTAYSECFTLLTKVTASIQLDPYLSAHVLQIVSSVKSKSFIQYFTPFNTVSIPKMAVVFQIPKQELVCSLSSSLLSCWKLLFVLLWLGLVRRMCGLFLLMACWRRCFVFLFLFFLFFLAVGGAHGAVYRQQHHCR